MMTSLGWAHPWILIIVMADRVPGEGTPLFPGYFVGDEVPGAGICLCRTMKSLEGALSVVGRPLCGPLVMKSLMQGTPLCPSSVVGDEVPWAGTSFYPVFMLIGRVPGGGAPMCPSSVVGDEVPGAGTSVYHMFV